MNIHLNHKGHDLGVFNQKQVEALFQSGAIDSSTLAWKDDEKDWTKLGVLYPQFVSVPPPISSTNGIMDIFGRRLSRGNFFVITVLYLIGMSIRGHIFSDYGGIFALLISIPYFVCISLRLRDVGWSPWWTLAALIPPVSVSIAGLALMMPKDYSKTRNMDLAAILAGIPLSILAIYCFFHSLGSLF